jgi:hypothetical protein
MNESQPKINITMLDLPENQNSQLLTGTKQECGFVAAKRATEYASTENHHTPDFGFCYRKRMNTFKTINT